MDPWPTQWRKQTSCTNVIDALLGTKFKVYAFSRISCHYKEQIDKQRTRERRQLASSVNNQWYHDHQNKWVQCLRSQCQTLGKYNSKQTLKAKRKLRVLSSCLKEPKFDSIADECIGRPLRPTSEQMFQRNGVHSQHILYAVRLVFAEAQNTQCGKEYNRENRAPDYVHRQKTKRKLLALTIT